MNDKQFAQPGVDAATDASPPDELHDLLPELMDARSGWLEADRRLQTLLDYSPEAIVLLDAETGQFVDVNPMAERLFGYPRAELLKRGPFDLSPPFQPGGDSVETSRAQIAKAVNGGAPIFEWWHCNSKGERFPCEVRLVKLPWGDRAILRACLLDTSVKKLLEISEGARRQLLENISRGVSLTTTLNALVLDVEMLLPGMKCSILLLEEDNEHLRLIAAPSLPRFYNDAVDGISIGPHVGSCGAAACTGERVIVSDITTHLNWAAFSHIAGEAELAACWSEPVISLSGNVLGTFAMYYHQASDPAPIELKVIEIAAQLTAIAIEYAQVQQTQEEINQTLRLRVAQETKHLSEVNEKLMAAEEECRLAAIAFNSHDSIIITDQAGKILQVNESCQDLTGYNADELIDKPSTIIRSSRNPPQLEHEISSAVNEHGHWEGTIWNRSKAGREFLQRTTITCLRNTAGQITHHVDIGQDITEEEKVNKVKAEIDAARLVQDALFPSSSPVLSGFDIAGAVFPAARISGDFFDYIQLDDNNVYLIVADVSGHGLAPSLLMAQTQAYLRALADSQWDPGQLLSRANHHFMRTDCGHFVTIVAGRLDAQNRTYTHAGAGHQAYVMRADGNVETLGSSSVPIGVKDSIEVTANPHVQLQPGDLIFLPTDGIEESCDEQTNLFSRQRMLDIVRDNRHKSAREIVDALYDATRRFSNGQPQQDDITAVVAKFSSG